MRQKIPNLLVIIRRRLPDLHHPLKPLDYVTTDNHHHESETRT